MWRHVDKKKKTLCSRTQHHKATRKYLTIDSNEIGFYMEHLFRFCF